MNRRAMLRTTALGAAALAQYPTIAAQSRAPILPLDQTWRYLATLAKDDGGYGWEGQPHSHLTPTFFVIGCARILNRELPGRERVADFVRRHHPAVLKKLEQERRIFEWQQLQALTWLGEDLFEFKPRILSWKEPVAYLKQYERHGYPLFSSEMGVILSRALLNVPTRELPAAFVAYLESRRRDNGSFNNTPASDGSDGHVSNTWWGLQVLSLLGREHERKEVLGDWLRACQRPNGGFTFAPEPEFGGVDDIAYLWSATRGLKLLGMPLAKPGSCVDYIRQLANLDGGFGDRAGWLSNPMATYYALDALRNFDAVDRFKFRPPSRRKTPPRLPEGLKVFSIQLEAHGQGSPAEAVDLAGSLRIHFWGAKNAKPDWIRRCQRLADARRVPVKFFVSNEEYGTWVTIPGMGTYSHTSDIIAPADADPGASAANSAALTWPEFRARRLEPLHRADGRLIWQFGENEELVRMFLDDSLARGGYAAVSTYHFGNPDFTNSEPFLHRWRGQLPFVALQDAHGPEPWWFADMTTGFRTVFVASEPTWENWLAALKNNWVAAIRHDHWSGGKTWIHAGSQQLRDFLQEHQVQWRWWDNPGVTRPLISLLALRPEDDFEVGRPKEGVALRLRCAWENTPQGFLKTPLVEFAGLTVDGQPASPAPVIKRRPNGNLLDDHYFYLPIPSLKPGSHIAEAKGRVLATGVSVTRAIQFST